MARTWFITGASRGFGALVAEQALKRGDHVVATTRDPASVTGRLGASPNLLTIALYVTDDAQAHAAADAAVARFGRIDILLNNAGFGLLGAVEEATKQEIKRVYVTNVFGLLAVTRAVLPHMRRQRSGHVLNISSIGGYAASAGWGVYCSTKARRCSQVGAGADDPRRRRGPATAYAIRRRYRAAHRGEKCFRGAGAYPLAQSGGFNRRHSGVTQRLSVCLPILGERRRIGASAPFGEIKHAKP